MSSNQRTIPLFQLNVVLFPNSALPLQIFEERYKVMLRDCLDTDSKFGVILIKSGSEVGGPAVPHDVGTVAHIVQANQVPGDRIFLSVFGQQRFRIMEIVKEEPYVVARVELLPEDVDAEVPPHELREVREAYIRQMRLTLGLRGGWVRDAPVPRDPTAMSYYIANVMKLELSEKQELLEEPSTARRLETELRLLTETAEALKARVTEELAHRRFSRQ